MKQVSLAVAAAALMSAAALPGTSYAAACVSGSLSSYISQGSCSDGNLVFSGFSYVPDGSNGGQTPAASAVTVVPVSGGLQFDSLWAAPTAGAISDAQLDYTTTTNDGSSITDASLQVAATAAGSGAFGSVTENFSNGASLTAGTATGLGPVDTTFAGVSSLGVTKDIDATAGAGTADVSSFNEGVSTSSVTVPAPPIGQTLPAILAMLGVLTIYGLRGRFRS